MQTQGASFCVAGCNIGALADSPRVAVESCTSCASWLCKRCTVRPLLGQLRALESCARRASGACSRAAEVGGNRRHDLQTTSATYAGHSFWVRCVAAPSPAARRARAPGSAARSDAQGVLLKADSAAADAQTQLARAPHQIDDLGAVTIAGGALVGREVLAAV